MATTSNTYTGNGTNKLFSITFPYLETSDINVYLNGVLQTITTHFSFANATTVEFVAAPSAGVAVLLDRSTDDTALQATFFPGSSIKANDLNLNFDQVLYLSQETANSAANQSTAGLQAQITTATDTANTAITTANAASATANGIASTANTALANAAVVTANAASVTATNADTTANAISATASSALTAANAALPKAGGTMTGVITYAAAQPRLVASTSQPSTSGTSIDFPSIPSWVKRITVMFQGVSTSAGSPVLIQLGTGSTPTYTTSGYLGAVLLVDAAGATARTTYTTGFLVTHDSANIHVRHGNITITNITGNSWTQTGILARSDDTSTHHSAGSIALAAVLTAVRITTVSGVNTFDLGAINLLLEG